MKTFKLYAMLGVVFLCLILVWNTLGIVKVEGSEAVIRQSLTEGVVDDVWRDGTHFYMGWLWDTYKYDIGTQKITFDNKGTNRDAEYPPIQVNVGENGGQTAYITLSVNYRIGHELTESGPRFNAAKLVNLHKDGLRENYESVILKRTIIEVVNRIARPRDALVIYSGKGYNEFVQEVEEALVNHPIFKERGILIENVIVYNVGLNPAYEQEIENKQLAIQKALREKEERKAADERALRVKSEAQAEVESRTQKAEAAKQERIKAAEAEKAEQVLRAEGERDSSIAKASGILAEGKAQAEVDALKRESLYAGESGAWRAKVEIAKNNASQLKGMLQGASVLTEKSVIMAGDMSGVKPTLNVQ